MNRKERREFEKKLDKLQKMKNKEGSFDRFLSESNLSAIGSREPFSIDIVLTNEDSEVHGIIEAHHGEPVIVYRQKSGGEITQVFSGKNKDITESFKLLEKSCLEDISQLGVEVPKSAIIFEVIKAFNFHLEEALGMSFHHILFTEKNLEQTEGFAVEVASHYQQNYGGKKPISLRVFGVIKDLEEELFEGEDSNPTWH